MRRYKTKKKNLSIAQIDVFDSFAYLTPKLRLDPKDLLSDKFPYFPIFIHCICSPERANEIVKEIDNRENHWFKKKRPKIVWEPIPDSATVRNERSTKCIVKFSSPLLLFCLAINTNFDHTISRKIYKNALM